MKKVISDPPATASLRWLLIYRILQQKDTWCLVKVDSTSRENELCNDTLPEEMQAAINNMHVILLFVVTGENDGRVSRISCRKTLCHAYCKNSNKKGQPKKSANLLISLAPQSERFNPFASRLTLISSNYIILT